MQLTGKEISRNNRISLGVTIFSFIVLLLFLIFKNIVTANPSLVSHPIQLNLALQAENNAENWDTKKTAGVYTGGSADAAPKKVVTVTDADIAAFNNITGELLQKYKAGSGKTGGNQAGDNTADLAPPQQGLSGSETISDPNAEYNLSKRQLISKPALVNDTREEGVVVVDILVDKDGNVTQADPNGRGTNTNSALLKTKAKQIAGNTKFSPAAGIPEQKGSITINFSFK